MRRPRYLDFKCPNCAAACTRFVETNDDDTPLEPQRCDVMLGEMTPDGPSVYDAGEPDGVARCQGPLAQVDTLFNGYMKTIVKGSHDFNERERERLEKRAGDHWQREGRHEAIERERSLFKKHGMEGTGGVK